MPSQGAGITKGIQNLLSFGLVFGGSSGGSWFGKFGHHGARTAKAGLSHFTGSARLDVLRRKRTGDSEGIMSPLLYH